MRAFPFALLPVLACAGAGANDTLMSTTVSSPASMEVPIGQSSPPRIAMAGPRRGPVTVDGRLDDGAWADVKPQGKFWQQVPRQGDPPSHATEFRVLYDDDALYVGVRAYDDDPDRIVGLLTRRDQWSSSDWITIGVDSYHDRRTAFQFSLNPAGVKRDVLAYDDTATDESWDAVWSGAAEVDDRGWVAEFRIPYSQLRFAGDRDQTWGLQVVRTVQRDNETSMWAPWPTDKNQNVSLYGDLGGLSGLEPSRRVEVQPYVVAGLEDSDPTASIGVDAKYGLGTNFTLSGTVNPDFGQVEADPSQVNLSADEIFFAEKRSFFLEGADIYRFGLSQGDGDDAVEQLFYSRRIGAFDTTIYGATKLSGKTASGWSIGALDAVTAANADQPLTNYGVLRVKKHFNSGRSEVGGALTTVHRSLDATTREQFHDQAYGGGAHASHRFADDEWSADLRVLTSFVRGDEAALDATQRASQRYFQRPDAAHLDYDPTRTSLAGFGAIWSIGKMAGGNWRVATGATTMSPGLEVNDLGFQRRSDMYTQWLWGQYREDRPGRVLRNWSVNTNLWSVWDYAPEQLTSGGNVNANGNLLNYWGGNAGVAINRNRQDPGGLRGGPMLRRDTGANAWLNLWSDPRKRVGGNLGASYWYTPASSSKGWSVNPWLRVQAASNLELGLGPSLSAQVDDNQFVTESVDASGEPAFVMGRIDQITTALTLRVAYTFTPQLSLQVYAQPFVSTGAYDDYKQVVDPQAASYDDRYAPVSDDVMFEAADFGFRELRSNVVARWEYLPGSTLFAIWSHNRTSADGDGSFALGDELAKLADEPGEHVVMLKLSYWLGL